LRHRYRASRRLLEIAVSLVEPEQIIDPAMTAQRSYSGSLRRRLITAGHAHVQGHTIEAEIEKVVGLLERDRGASAAADSRSPTR
jgi:hypothetical protein